jgi:hypothetical protein
MALLLLVRLLLPLRPRWSPSRRPQRPLRPATPASETGEPSAGGARGRARA